MCSGDDIYAKERSDVYERLDLTDVFKRFPADSLLALEHAQGLKQSLHECLAKSELHYSISGSEQ